MAMSRAHRFKRALAVDDVSSKPRIWGVLVLFASVPTLLCCALPILLVSLGMGSLVASIYGEYLPFLRWFGLHEQITFGTTAAILLVAAWTLFRPGRSCPVDCELAARCQQARKWNLGFFWGAIVIWSVGAFSAFILPVIA